MRILIVSPFENKATGRGDRNIRLQQELVDRGHEVVFITGDFDHAQKKRLPENKLSESSNLRVLKLPRYKSNVSLARMWCHFVFAVKLWWEAKYIHWDAVIVSSIPPDVLIATKCLRKAKLIVDVRDIWPDALQSYGQPSIASRVFSIFCNFIYSSTLKDADKILIVAPGFRKWLKNYGIAGRGKVRFVPLGFRREDFQPLSSGGGETDFCYAGGATPQFDIREFKKDFGQKKGAIVGSGPLLEEWRKAFPKSEFYGSVPRSNAMLLMSQSKKLLFPSNPFAQLPNKAFDYFALGYPVEFGSNCSRATKSLLNLRLRKAKSEKDTWEDYRSIEKEAIAQRAADIIEEEIL